MKQGTQPSNAQQVEHKVRRMHEEGKFLSLICLQGKSTLIASMFREKVSNSVTFWKQPLTKAKVISFIFTQPV